MNFITYQDATSISNTIGLVSVVSLLDVEIEDCSEGVCELGLNKCKLEVPSHGAYQQMRLV